VSEQETTAVEPSADERPEADVMRAAATELLSFAERDPSVFHTAEQVLEHELARGVTPDTIRRLGFSLGQVLGDQGGVFLGNYLSADEPGGLLKVAEELGAPDAVVGGMRRLQALFGHAVAEAWSLHERELLDWSGLHREVWYDIIGKRWILELRITRYDGTEFSITASPYSMANLAVGVIRSLNFVTDAEQFGQEMVAGLMEQFNEFAQKVGYTVVQVDEKDEEAEEKQDEEEIS